MNKMIIDSIKKIKPQYASEGFMILGVFGILSNDNNFRWIVETYFYIYSKIERDRNYIQAK